MAARKPTLPKAGKDRGVLAANVQIHGAGPNGESVWYGPSYPENGEPPAALAANLPPHVWDAQKVWPTKQDAEAAGLAWDEPIPPTPPAADEEQAGGSNGDS